MSNYPPSLPPVGHTAPVPRRIRAVLDGHVVVDTIGARSVWAWPHYPHYYLPVADIDPACLIDDDAAEDSAFGTVHRHTLRVGDTSHVGAVGVLSFDAVADLGGFAHIDWNAVDAWYEEDEEVFVHPRDPYTRIDILRSTRRVRVEIDGVVLAQSASPLVLFETGLPPRSYLNPTEVDFSHLRPTDTVTRCPYKGTTSDYWDAHVGKAVHHDIAWTYRFPTQESIAIAGLVAFYDERVDVFVDGDRQDRPETPFS